MKQKPLFITFEGCEGSGKSTQSKILYDALLAEGLQCVHTREPGGTKSAETIRGLLLDKELKLETKSQLLLHFVARLEHIHDVILPSLNQGKIVICDRYVDSTMAYQSYAGEEDPQLVKLLHEKFIDNLMPKITFIMDVPLETSLRRIKKKQNSSDRYENLDQKFHENIVYGFREIAKNNPKRCIMLDASQSIDVVSTIIFDKVSSLLQ